MRTAKTHMTQTQTYSVKLLASKQTFFFFSFHIRISEREIQEHLTRAHKNTKREINNRSFVVTPCQKGVGVFQKLSSSFNTILYPHDQRACLCSLFFFSSFFFLAWRAGEVTDKKGNTDT